MVLFLISEVLPQTATWILSCFMLCMSTMQLVVRSSTPRVCPIQPDSDIGEELAKEKGRNPMKSPKD
ncbi:hypothetical protein Bca4012_100757 [Brassica carinata]